MIEHEREIREALKQSIPPVNTKLPRDLWPAVLRRIDADHLRVPWYDWALIGLSASVILLYPRLVLVFVYHL